MGGPVAVLWRIRACVPRAPFEHQLPPLSPLPYNMTLEVGDNGASQPHSQSPSQSQSQSPEDSGDQETVEMAEHSEPSGRADSQSLASNGQTKSALNTKDPLRPRRKKARRACYACQRAHLTCGEYCFCSSSMAFHSTVYCN